MSSLGTREPILIESADRANLQPGPWPPASGSKRSQLSVPAAHCRSSLWSTSLTHSWSHKSWLPRGVLSPSFRQGRRPCPPTRDPRASPSITRGSQPCWITSHFGSKLATTHAAGPSSGPVPEAALAAWVGSSVPPPEPLIFLSLGRSAQKWQGSG